MKNPKSWTANCDSSPYHRGVSFLECPIRGSFSFPLRSMGPDYRRRAAFRNAKPGNPISLSQANTAKRQRYPTLSDHEGMEPKFSFSCQYWNINTWPFLCDKPWKPIFLSQAKTIRNPMSNGHLFTPNHEAWFPFLRSIRQENEAVLWVFSKQNIWRLLFLVFFFLSGYWIRVRGDVRDGFGLEVGHTCMY